MSDYSEFAFLLAKVNVNQNNVERDVLCKQQPPNINHPLSCVKNDNNQFTFKMSVFPF
jgi:23S rRNA A1618 N6-methylase RlmF